MKKMEIFCASQASTAVCLSMEQVASSSCSSATAIQLGGRAIDRHNPIIRDAKRFTITLPSNPCTSQPPPINPLPYHQLKKNQKKCSSNDHPKKTSSSSAAVAAKLNDHKKKKKSSSKNSSLKPSDTKAEETSRKSFTSKEIDLVTPPGSTRYLLGDNSNTNSGVFNRISDYDPVWELVPAETSKIQAVKQDQSIVSQPSPPSTPEKPSKDQVVVLRVSLHCKGCVGKVRKHLSRMEGVTSFSIDYPAKKVTIFGDVTPLGALASVSKVKSAQFWTSAMAASSANTANK